MDIIRELQKGEINDLRLLTSQDHDFRHIDHVLSMPYVYEVSIPAGDFDSILINSSNEPRELAWAEYPTLRTVIESIQHDRSFFLRTRSDRGLNGQLVKIYMDEFTANRPRPNPCFIVDRSEFPGMNEQGQFYVRDGMHHLVAYGLATELKDEGFPIKGYYGSRQARTIFSLGTFF